MNQCISVLAMFNATIAASTYVFVECNWGVGDEHPHSYS
jgi:hypothetical protein